MASKNGIDTSILRTCAIQATPEELGTVYLYEAGAPFKDAWQAVHSDLRKDVQDRQRKYMPTQSLQTALRVESDDLVLCEQRFKRFGKRKLFLISRRPLDQDRLTDVLYSWEVNVTKGESGYLAEAADSISCREMPLAEVLKHRAGRTPIINERWFWNVAHWHLAKQLLAAPLRLENGVEIPMRLDTSGELLSWGFKGLDLPGQDAFAHYRIQIHAMTVPGIENLVLQVQPSISRLIESWWDRSERGWMDLGPERLLHQAKIAWDQDKSANNPDRDKTGGRIWSDRTVDVLSELGKNIPDPDSDPLAVRDRLRMIYPKQKPGLTLGRGPTQLFYDAVAHWLHASAPNAEPLTFKRSASVPSLTSKTLGENIEERKHARPTEEDLREMIAAQPKTPRLLIVYKNIDVERRMKQVLGDVFHADPEALQVETGEVVTLDCGLEVVFVSPKASQALLQFNPTAEAGEMVTEAVTPFLEDDRQVVAVVETLSADTLKKGSSGSDDTDPKKEIREWLAGKGVTTQFIRSNAAIREEDTDHSATRALWDAMRTVGLFPLPVPVTAISSDNKPCLIGAYGVQRKTSGKHKNAYDLVLVATKAGERGFWAYNYHEDGWRPLGEATAKLHSKELNLQPYNKAKDRRMLEKGLRELREIVEGPYILFANQGLNPFWRFLSDTHSDSDFPRLVEDMDLAILRARHPDEKVPQAAGIGLWDEIDAWREREPSRHLPKPAAKDTGFRLRDVEASPYYYVAHSAVHSQSREDREHTRPNMAERYKRDDFHSLSTREFWVVRSGPFNATRLGQYAAFLCRFALNWKGRLRYPAPLHLAKTISDDHPRNI